MYLDAAKKQEIFGKYGKSKYIILRIDRKSTRLNSSHCD